MLLRPRRQDRQSAGVDDDLHAVAEPGQHLDGIDPSPAAMRECNSDHIARQHRLHAPDDRGQRMDGSVLDELARPVLVRVGIIVSSSVEIIGAGLQSAVSSTTFRSFEMSRHASLVFG